MDAPRPSTALFDVYLRLRPAPTPDTDRFLAVEHPPSADAHPTHITIRAPANDNRKRAVEKFAFTRVFEEGAGQRELFESTGILPLIEGVLGKEGREGRDGLVATLGVTGSGKSHTILGSKSQRGLTQLALDVLYHQTAPHLVETETSPAVFASLASADVSEAYLLPAGHFLDAMYSSGSSTESRGSTYSRATTPALVRETPSSYIHMHCPGAFPTIDSVVAASKRAAAAAARPSMAVFDRLTYPSLSKYHHHHHPPSPLSPHKPQPAPNLPPPPQDSSFISLPPQPPTSKRHPPRLSALPTHPSTADLATLPAPDPTAAYAILISIKPPPNPARRRPLLFKPTEHSPDRKVVAGLRKIVCTSLAHALLVLETGLQERRVAGTGTNAASSRSHGFFCVEVKKRLRATRTANEGPWSTATLTIVDLAGSERARTAKTAGATLAEAGKINESLMYLGQCMQMQADNATASTAGAAQGVNNGGVPQANLVPYRQCKLTELLFSNSFAREGGGGGVRARQQRGVMIVTADPWGDFNATGQILRYSALAREVTVARVASVTGAIVGGAARAASGMGTAGGGAGQEELEAALAALAALREEVEVAQMLLAEETRRRQAAELSWNVAELRCEAVEAEVREEVWGEFEARMAGEQRRWRAGRAAEMDAQDEHLDRKLELLTLGLDLERAGVWEDESAETEAGKENVAPAESHFYSEDLSPSNTGKHRHHTSHHDIDIDIDIDIDMSTTEGAKTADSPAAAHLRARNSLLAREMLQLEDANRALRERLAKAEQPQQQRSPSKKMRVLKTASRGWAGSGVGLDDC
ncbi:hypothetical protein LTR08_008608 [Meristemomyces frigidus]|nr:hypothetical protein LTR08_008608 [Meristemomyces frigidus]